MSSAEICRKNGWRPGNFLEGDEGYGPTVIQLTAIGAENVLARMISHDGKPADCRESHWTLEYRGWKRIERPTE